MRTSIDTRIKRINDGLFLHSQAISISSMNSLLEDVDKNIEILNDVTDTATAGRLFAQIYYTLRNKGCAAIAHYFLTRNYNSTKDSSIAIERLKLCIRSMSYIEGKAAFVHSDAGVTRDEFIDILMVADYLVAPDSFDTTETWWNDIKRIASGQRRLYRYSDDEIIKKGNEYHNLVKQQFINSIDFFSLL